MLLFHILNSVGSYMYMFVYHMCIFLSGGRPQGGGKKIDTENLLRDNLLFNQQQNNRWSEEGSIHDKAFGIYTRKDHLSAKASVSLVLYLPVPYGVDWLVIVLCCYVSCSALSLLSVGTMMSCSRTVQTGRTKE